MNRIDLLSHGSRQLLHALHECEARLGTCQELPNDFTQARELAHRLANAMTSDFLQADLNVHRGIRSSLA